MIAVAGTSAHGSKWNPEIRDAAWQIGRWVAEAGAATLTGGLTGVMESALQGAHWRTVAILPTLDRSTVNIHAEIVLPTPFGIARNVLTAAACSSMVALPGGNGTMEEVLFALDYERPVAAVNVPPWERAMAWPRHELLEVFEWHDPISQEALHAWIRVHGSVTEALA